MSDPKCDFTATPGTAVVPVATEVGAFGYDVAWSTRMSHIYIIYPHGATSLHPWALGLNWSSRVSYAPVFWRAYSIQRPSALAERARRRVGE